MTSASFGPSPIKKSGRLLRGMRQVDAACFNSCHVGETGATNWAQTIVNQTLTIARHNMRSPDDGAKAVV